MASSDAFNQDNNMGFGTPLISSAPVSTRVHLQQFEQLPVANGAAIVATSNRDWEHVAEDTVVAFAPGGGLTLTPASLTGVPATLWPQQTAEASSVAATEWRTVNALTLDAAVKVAAQIAADNPIIEMGFKSSPDVLTDDVHSFSFRAVAGEWRVVVRIQNIETDVATGVSVTPDETIRLSLLCTRILPGGFTAFGGQNQLCRFAVNGVVVAALPVVGGAYEDLKPYVSVRTAGGGAPSDPTLVVRGLRLIQKFFPE